MVETNGALKDSERRAARAEFKIHLALLQLVIGLAPVVMVYTAITNVYGLGTVVLVFAGLLVLTGNCTFHAWRQLRRTQENR